MKRTIPTDHFLQNVSANIDNEKLSDSDLENPFAILSSISEDRHHVAIAKLVSK